MKRRAVLFTAVGLAALCVSVPAWADDDGSGDGKDSEDDAEEDDDEDEEDQEPEDDSEGSDDDLDSGDHEDSGDDHDAAKSAVDASEALPLDKMLGIFRQRGDFTVIDVRLVRTSGGRLWYMIKFIDGSGAVRKSYFDALTGALVR